MTKKSDKKTDYQSFINSRNSYTAKILNSKSRKKIIVAGPGTGKSHVFKEMCKQNIESGLKKNLTLSFINELVTDLKTELYEYSEVMTLHSFALQQIGKSKYYLDLEKIIAKDYELFSGKNVDFSKKLNNLDLDPELINYYEKRLEYYDYHSPISSVYKLVQKFQSDFSSIPKYSQLLIDEFQDFNILESTLIDLLEQNSPILIVGDDDQSLYGWKQASPIKLKDKYLSTDYETFELPFCSRCTRVVIDAFSDVINEAIKQGFLLNRIANKKFQYFPSEEKDAVSEEFSEIESKKIYPKSEAFHIDAEIKKLIHPKNKEGFTVHIICPFNKQIDLIEKKLREKGYKNIITRNSIKQDDFVKGLKILLVDKDSNLGWRLVSENILNNVDFSKIIISSNDENNSKINFSSLLSLKDRTKIKKLLTSINRIIKNQDIKDDQLAILINQLNIDGKRLVKNEVLNIFSEKDSQKNSHKDIPIRLTTILGSKGLSSDFVFLAHFDDKYLLKNKNITNEAILNFLVALTRMKRKVFVFRNDKSLSTLISWIKKERLDEK